MKRIVPLYLLCTVYFTLRGFQNLGSVYWLGITQIALSIMTASFSQYILIKENRIEKTKEEDED